MCSRRPQDRNGMRPSTPGAAWSGTRFRRTGKRSRPCSTRTQSRPIHRQPLADNRQGFIRAQEIFDGHPLVLEDLLVLEKASDLSHHMDRELRMMGVVAKPWIVDADGNYFVVTAF